MTPTEMETLLQNLDARVANIEQILPTLATREGLAAVRTELTEQIHSSAHTVRTELTEQIQSSAQALRTELSERIDASAQAVRADLTEQITHSVGSRADRPGQSADPNELPSRASRAR